MAKKTLEESLIETIINKKIGIKIKLRKMDYIIRLGADKNYLWRGKSPLCWAKKEGDSEVIQFLENIGAREEVISDSLREEYSKRFFIAVREDNFDEMMECYNKGADIGWCNIAKQTPLMEAVYHSYDALKFLADKVDANINMKNSFGETALMIASDADRYMEAKTLLDNGANIDEQDFSGRTALILASDANCFSVAGLLISRGADIGIKDVDGKTAWDCAGDRMSQVMQNAINERNLAKLLVCVARER
ncbi:MAG: ankyrin repeat domain-containing protein [Alphaproteobacteria bacterium]|nr:ankyrin repeat domain-containing protein [Alphaproteobacteria bacterium]